MTIATGLITICWLLPLAILVGVGVLEGVTGVLIGYIPLVVVAIWLKAGDPKG